MILMIGGEGLKIELDLPEWLYSYLYDVYALQIKITIDNDLTFEEFVTDAISCMVRDLDPKSIEIHTVQP